MDMDLNLIDPNVTVTMTGPEHAVAAQQYLALAKSGQWTEDYDSPKERSAREMAAIHAQLAMTAALLDAAVEAPSRWGQWQSAFGSEVD